MQDSKVQQAQAMVEQLEEIVVHFTQLLEGFEIYNEYKGVLDIGVYEKSLEVYTIALSGMQEQIRNFKDVVNGLKSALQE